MANDAQCPRWDQDQFRALRRAPDCLGSGGLEERANALVGRTHTRSWTPSALLPDAPDGGRGKACVRGPEGGGLLASRAVERIGGVHLGHGRTRWFGLWDPCAPAGVRRQGDDARVHGRRSGSPASARCPRGHERSSTARSGGGQWHPLGGVKGDAGSPEPE
ncbi:hypothetical protein BD413DRAFT_280381 [Trametes elegans]|nr:hypothetical protein BD413DRAFT_280381 [Trametes elegans]